MSYLPYASAPLSGWLAATGSSVLAHGLMIGLTFGGIQTLFDLAASRPEDPGFTITLERLDSDTIAGLLEQDGVAGSDEEGAAQGEEPLPEAETPEPDSEPEQIAALAPEDLPEPEPEPETEPEPAEDAAPVVPEDMTAEPVESLSALPAPEAITPLSPLIGTAPTTVPLTSAAPSAAPQTLRPLEPVAGDMQVVSARPTPQETAPRPAAKPAPPPSAQDLAIGDLIRRIQATEADPCLVSLPRRDGEEGVGLAMIASADRAMSSFTDALLTEPSDADIRQTRTLIDQRQCPALTYVRQNRDYPATRLGVRLDAAEVPSGGNLTGVLRGTGGRYLMLLLVDNNGVVQDLARFVSYSGNFARFDVPVTRVGVQRDTSQVLLAIATDRPTAVIRDRVGQLAQDVFAGLEGEVASAAALAITVFDVR